MSAIGEQPRHKQSYLQFRNPAAGAGIADLFSFRCFRHYRKRNLRVVAKKIQQQRDFVVKRKVLRLAGRLPRPGKVVWIGTSALERRASELPGASCSFNRERLLRLMRGDLRGTYRGGRAGIGLDGLVRRSSSTSEAYQILCRLLHFCVRPGSLCPPCTLSMNVDWLAGYAPGHPCSELRARVEIFR